MTKARIAFVAVLTLGVVALLVGFVYDNMLMAGIGTFAAAIGAGGATPDYEGE